MGEIKDWISDRQHTLEAAHHVQVDQEAIRSLARERLVAKSPELWKSLAKEIASCVERYNQLQQSPIRELTSLAASDDILLVTGTVVEPVPGLWFRAPQKVTLQIQFDPVRCTVSYCVLARVPTESLYFETSLAGKLALHFGPQALSIEDAAERILSRILDITDPLPAK